MDVRIDHMILPVDDLVASIDFYGDVLGFKLDGKHGPFDVLRVSDAFVILLMQFASGGGLHLAFSFSEARFAQILAGIKSSDLDYGDRFDQASNRKGPSPQPGATGDEPGIYITDPSRHLVEIRRSSG